MSYVDQYKRSIIKRVLSELETRYGKMYSPQRAAEGAYLERMLEPAHTMQQVDELIAEYAFAVERARRRAEQEVEMHEVLGLTDEKDVHPRLAQYLTISNERKVGKLTLFNVRENRRRPGYTDSDVVEQMKGEVESVKAYRLSRQPRSTVQWDEKVEDDYGRPLPESDDDDIQVVLSDSSSSEVPAAPLAEAVRRSSRVRRPTRWTRDDEF